MLTAVGVFLATAFAGCAVVWLAVHVLADVPEPAHPLVDAAELLKFAMATGLSEWTAAARTP